MKIKRFLAPNMREALKAVRTEQGPDAVILSNRRVGDYIEIIAALDYDEALVKQALRQPAAPSEATTAVPSEVEEDETEVVAATQDPVRDLLAMVDQGTAHAETHRIDDTHVTALEVEADGHALGGVRSELAALRDLIANQVGALSWQQQATRDPVRAQVLRNLTRLGIEPDIARRVCDEIERTPGKFTHAWRQPIAELSRALPVADESLIEHGGVAAFVGPTGVGKTTTIAKIASQYAVRHGARDIALVSMDSYRIGAQDQLRTFGRIINASVFEASGPAALRGLLERLEDYRLVLIDTAGVSQRDVRLAQMLDGLASQKRPVDLYLALAATTDAPLLDEVVRQYGQVRLKAAVLTKIDEASRLGAPLSVLIRNGLPLTYLCDGQRVPDDLSSAVRRKLWLMNRALEYASEDQFLPEELDLAERFGRAEASHG